MNKPKGETDHCRNRLLKYCKGQGLDLGCGLSKIRPNAIGIDLLSPMADMNIDARLLPCYPNEHFDYIYSSHLLEEIEDTESTLREWIRLIKEGGHIILYQADKDHYYPMGDPRCNQSHKHHFDWEILWAIFQKIGGMELVHHAGYFEEPHNEWSFELVVRKEGKQQIESEMHEGISILVPTLNRPKNIEDFSESIDKTTTDPSNVEIVFGIHEDDPTSKEKIEEINPKLKIDVRYEFIKRHDDGKVHLAFLWNQLYKKAKHPIVGYFGDDVLSHTPGWDIEVKREFAEEKNILVACNDVHVQKGKNATLFFTHKSFHDEIGFYLNPKFRRWYTDTFWDVVFKNAGKLHFREDLVMEHLHPDIFKERLDETYKAMESHKGDDREIWLSKENRDEVKKYIEFLKSM
jgi:predicted SAM-dependent methyltransferase